MADTNKLREEIAESGITITALAAKAGLSRETFYHRLNSGEFKVTEMLKISEALHLSDADRERIFFAPECE